MNDISALEKELRKRKRVAAEWAMQLHDLVEDKLPGGFEELPALADATYQACQAWQQAKQALDEAQ